jgi:hypothetical protein
VLLESVPPEPTVRPRTHEGDKGMTRADAGPCPPPDERLRQYHDRTLPTEGWLEIGAHVGGCAMCGRHLETQGELDLFAMSGALRGELPPRLWGPLDRFMDPRDPAPPTPSSVSGARFRRASRRRGAWTDR